MQQITIIFSDSTVVFASSDSDSELDYWTPYQLCNCDRQSLDSGMDLTENVINAAETILKNQFGMGGFQSTTCNVPQLHSNFSI